MPEDRILHFGRIDVFAARNDHVLHAVMDVEEAVLVEIACVARMEESVTDRFGRCIGPVPVTLHHEARLDHDLAHLAGWHGISVTVHAAHDSARPWHATAAQLAPGRVVRFRRQVGACAHSLRQAIELGKLHTHDFLGFQKEALGNRRGAIGDDLHRREVHLPDLGMLGHGIHHGLTGAIGCPVQRLGLFQQDPIILIGQLDALRAPGRAGRVELDHVIIGKRGAVWRAIWL